MVVFEGLAAVALQEEEPVVYDSKIPNILTCVPTMMAAFGRVTTGKEYSCGVLPRGSGFESLLQQLGILHLYFHILNTVTNTVFSRLSRTVIRPQSNSCLGFLLRIGFILQCLDSIDRQPSSASATQKLPSYLLLCVLPLRWVTMLCSLSNHFAHSMQ